MNMKKALFSLTLALTATFGFSQCDPQSAINENFDDWSAIDPCWKGVANGGMFFVEGDVTFYSFMGADVSMYLISPEIVAGNYNLTFDFGTVSMDGQETEGITIEVGTVTNNANGDSFASVSSPIATTIATQSFTVPVTITSDAKYFAIKVHSTAPHSAALVDNLVLNGGMSVSDLESVKVSAYPNPVVDQLNITSKQNIKEVKIFNVNGQLVLNTKANNSSTTVNVSSLKSGIYVAQVTTDKGTETIKVIKK